MFAKTHGVDNHNSLAGNAVITDHLGSIVTLLNSAGGVAQQNQFDPFGQVISSTNTNSFGGQAYGFTGLEHDESGLVYARNRYYSPGLGRFISEDPIGFGGGSNFFAYCGNDPINFTDPLGLFGVQFGNVNIGIGNPDLAFDLNTYLDGYATGFNAFASALSGGLYDGGAYRCMPGFAESVGLATGGIAMMPGPAGVVMGRVQMVGGGLRAARDGDLRGMADSGADMAMGRVPGGAPGTRAGKGFTPVGKNKILEANKARNNGKIKCEVCDVECVKPEKSMSGVTPDPLEWQIDHKNPQSRNGSGTPENGQVLCRKCNRDKWDK